MNILAKILKGIGYLWVTFAIIIIIIGYVMILYKHGLGHLLDILSPFNIWNTLAVILILAPGALMIYIGKKIRRT